MGSACVQSSDWLVVRRLQADVINLLVPACLGLCVCGQSPVYFFHLVSLSVSTKQLRDMA